jgi:hypothetical protein
VRPEVLQARRELPAGRRLFGLRRAFVVLVGRPRRGGLRLLTGRRWLEGGDRHSEREDQAQCWRHLVFS